MGDTADETNDVDWAELDRRDPALVEAMLKAVRVGLRYFDPEVQHFERLPEEGPFLIVGNHSGGMLMPDYWAFLDRWVRDRGAEAPLYALGFDLLFAVPAAASLLHRVGSVPANRANASALLDRGHPVLVYPGGDQDDYRPWTKRHEIELYGRTGFVKLALRHQVPVVPLVSHGSHDAIIVVTRGDQIADALRLDRLRIGVFPIVLGPLGLSPVSLAIPPFPAKVTSRVCEPIDWSALGPDAADDPEVVSRCYDEIHDRMQETLDDLVREVPHPVRTRIGNALGLDRLGRLNERGG
ncbi:MAG: acyltransferase family protein [Acidimicrobiales bacterium]|nr:acyltransferase family protein [Acidimicrobiales bacterium]